MQNVFSFYQKTWSRGIRSAVEHLAYIDAGVAVVLEELWDGGEVAANLPEPRVEVDDVRGVRPPAGHQGGAARAAHRLLHVSPLEHQAPLG